MEKGGQRGSLTFQHLPPEALSRDQPWTPERRLGGFASGCVSLTHRLGWLHPQGCHFLTFPCSWVFHPIPTALAPLLPFCPQG